jgi:hypothetical protein
MGGDYYDRDVYTDTTGVGYSVAATNVIVTKGLAKEMNPLRFEEECLKCDKEDPIVFALDVTGSMGDWSKIIFDKMPMFYGQIKQHDYLKDPAISFCGIGDYTSDEAPLQVSDFAQGTDIDNLLKHLYLEGGGGGGYQESYEMAAYFYNKQVELLGHEYPFFFITGDEGFRDTIKQKYISKYLGLFEKTDVSSKMIWDALLKKYNVFLIKKPYDSPNETIVRKMWEDALGEERVLHIQNAKACIDIILGAIALTSGKRTLKEYLKDMEERGQTKNRREEVEASLEIYWKKLSNRQVNVVKRTVDINDKYLNNVIKSGTVDFREIVEASEKIKLDGLSEEKLIYINSLKKMKETFKDTIPQEFFCPITAEIFFDPVMTSDGQTYEKSAIEEWLKNNEKSPLTGKNLANKKLIPNFVMKKLINSFYEMNKKDL